MGASVDAPLSMGEGVFMGPFVGVSVGDLVGGLDGVGVGVVVLVCTVAVGRIGAGGDPAGADAVLPDGEATSSPASSSSAAADRGTTLPPPPEEEKLEDDGAGGETDEPRGFRKVVNDWRNVWRTLNNFGDAGGGGAGDAGGGEGKGGSPSADGDSGPLWDPILGQLPSPDSLRDADVNGLLASPMTMRPPQRSRPFSTRLSLPTSCSFTARATRRREANDPCHWLVCRGVWVTWGARGHPKEPGGGVGGRKSMSYGPRRFLVSLALSSPHCWFFLALALLRRRSNDETDCHHFWHASVRTRFVLGAKGQCSSLTKQAIPGRQVHFKVRTLQGGQTLEAAHAGPFAP